MAKNDNNPLVSVIVPVYNRVHLLSRAIESIANQTYGNLEIIVVDDGSSEDVKSVVAGFNDKRTVYLKHNENRGLPEARNSGIKAAAGDFVEFLDADDEYLPEKTEKQLDIFTGGRTSEKTDVVYCGMWREVFGRMEYSLHPSRISKWFFMVQQIMIRRKALNSSLLFDGNFKFVEDMDFVYRLSRTLKFEGTDEPLLIYYDAPESASKNRFSMIKYEQLFLVKHSSTLSKKEISRRYYSIGRKYVRLGRRLRGYRNFAKAYITCPMNQKALRKLIRYAPSVLLHCMKKHGKS